MVRSTLSALGLASVRPGESDRLILLDKFTGKQVGETMLPHWTLDINVDDSHIYLTNIDNDPVFMVHDKNALLLSK